ncbi:hypothetical protein [Aequorivita echinoideorum]|uniref:Pentapeptide repeat-containing protein n=1 Tax=Aequorivita echinoideorum TaxID=1549647 RepID=A0ABS5S312_9FLAO|nr:hypothetical protein [Aequorivita echinoideorum]MBT0606824.1 hypothetical protein [Aequorivita echinoideorum]
MATRTIYNLADFYQDIKTDTLDSHTQKGVDKPVKLDATIISWKTRTLYYVFFEEIVEILDVDINLGLSFVGCTFNKGIVFSNVRNTGVPTTNEDSNGGIFFLNCKGLYISFQNGCEIMRGVGIYGNSDFQQLILKQCKIENGGITIKESSISKLFDISNCVFPVRIDNSEIKTFRVETLTGDITLINTKFSDWVKFWNIECPNSLTLNNNTFEQDFDVRASRIKGFFIHGDTFHRKGKLENRDDSGNNFDTYLNEIYITEANFVEGFEFDGMSKNLSKLTLPMSPNFQGVLRIIGWKVHETWITGINQNLKLLFKRIDFKRIIINDFSNFGVLSFDECNADNENFISEEDPNSSFHFSNSSLNNTRFSEVNFQSFDFINTANVSFEGIEASNVKWFADEKLRLNSARPSNEIAFRRKREIYRQIKQALKSKGNKIDSLIFQSREMQAYRNELKSSGKYKCSDKIIMTVNRTNGYGLKWIKPLMLIILVTLLTYILSIPLFSDKMNWCCGKFIGFKNYFFEVVNNLPALAQMFNPARRFSETFGENVASGLYFVDLLHRVVLGILIFQLILAFRRLSSK